MSPCACVNFSCSHLQLLHRLSLHHSVLLFWPSTLSAPLLAVITPCAIILQAFRLVCLCGIFSCYYLFLFLSVYTLGFIFCIHHSCFYEEISLKLSVCVPSHVYMSTYSYTSPHTQAHIHAEKKHTYLYLCIHTK